MKKVLFVDRDGTLIVEPQDASKSPNNVSHQVDSLEQLEFLPGAIEAMKRFIDAGFSLVMVTNQNGIGSESFPEEDFWIPQNEMLRRFKQAGVEFEEVFICPHFKHQDCNCSKPKTGLVDNYLAENEIDLKNSYMIGDRDTDLEFAANIGVKGIKIGPAKGWPQIVDEVFSIQGISEK